MVPVFCYTNIFDYICIYNNIRIKLYICFMVTYKDRMRNKKTFVLQKENEVIATFGNLKKACEYLEGQGFYSYNTVVRKDDKDYPISYNGFVLFKVKHY